MGLWWLVEDLRETGTIGYRRGSWIFYMRKIYHFIGLSSGPRFISGRHSRPPLAVSAVQPVCIRISDRPRHVHFPSCLGRLVGRVIQHESSRVESEFHPSERTGSYHFANSPWGTAARSESFFRTYCSRFSRKGSHIIRN